MSVHPSVQLITFSFLLTSEHFVHDLQHIPVFFPHFLKYKWDCWFLWSIFINSGLRYSSALEHLPSVHKAQGLSLSHPHYMFANSTTFYTLITKPFWCWFSFETSTNMQRRKNSVLTWFSHESLNEMSVCTEESLFLILSLLSEFPHLYRFCWWFCPLTWPQE